MKHAVILVALLFASPGWAQPAATSTQNAAGLTPEQVKVIKDNLRGISDVMGVPKPESQSEEAKPETPKKSMADVADHALEMMSGLVVKVAGTLEKVAPKFWTIMVKQQYAKAVADTIVPISLTLFALGWGLFFKKKIGYPSLTARWGDSEYMQFWFSILIPAVGLCVFFVWSTIAVSDAAKYVINPEYYAVRDILMMFSQPGSL